MKELEEFDRHLDEDARLLGTLFINTPKRNVKCSGCLKTIPKGTHCVTCVVPSGQWRAHSHYCVKCVPKLIVSARSILNKLEPLIKKYAESEEYLKTLFIHTMTK